MDARELIRMTKVVTNLLAAVFSTDQNGTAIDLAQWEANTFLLTVGAPGITLDGSNYIRFFMEESDDNSVFTAVADDDIIGAVETPAGTGEVIRVDAAGEASKSYLVAYKGAKRYARLRTDFVGTHGTGTLVGIVSLPQRGRFTGKNQFSS